MKRLLTFSAVILTAMMLKSCINNDDPTNYTTMYTYATVCEDEQQESGVSFVTDYGLTFYVTTNFSDTDLKDLEAGERKMTYVKLEASQYTGYSYSATLNSMSDVTMGECLTVETEEENEELADYPITYFQTSANASVGYLNISIGIESDDIENAKFYLVENLSEESESEDEDSEETTNNYLNLELRIDNNNNSGKGQEYQQYITFLLEPFRTQLKDKYGITLRLNTEKDDIIYYTISSTQLFAD